MRQARYAHSSCVLKGQLYVFGGLSERSYLGTIEFLDLRVGQVFKWVSFTFPLFEPRWNTAVAPISASEIAILGGRHEGGFQNEVLILNTLTREMTRAINHTQIRFDCESPAMMVRSGEVIALVDNLKDVCLIKYQRATNTITIEQVITFSQTMQNFVLGSC